MDPKRYLHVNPPWYVFHGGGLSQPNVPLNAAYLARVVLEEGWDALTWNGDFTPAPGEENQYSPEMASYEHYLDAPWREHPVWDELRALLRDYRPDVTGITSLTPSHFSALHTARIVKEEMPGCLTALGGPHPSALPEEVAADPAVDHVVVGEGEVALGLLLRAWRMGNGVPVVVVAAPARDLDALGWPARDVSANWGLNRDHFGLLMYARGCPFGCSFCASRNVWGRWARWRSARDVVAEMTAIHRDYDTRYFSFEDDTFTLNRERTVALMDAIIETGLTDVPGFRWTCNTRPDLVDAELLVRMREAGCAAVAVGIESGNARILRLMNKGFTVAHVRRAVAHIKAAGMVASGQFMVGYPTETEAEMWETVRLADELECGSVMLSVAAPLPGTELYGVAAGMGLVPAENVDWAAMTTKNDGVLMTIECHGGHMPMPRDERRRLVAELREAFDRVEAKTLAAKNVSRMGYERQYRGAVQPVYGFGNVAGDVP